VIAVAMDPTYLDRFGGIGRLYGLAGMARFEAAHVAVVGVGGVGSWVVEALARAGVGALTLIDMDDVCVTNTNRQLPALNGTMGLPKVRVLAERVRAINPACRVTPEVAFLTESTVERLLAPGFDFVVDAVDRMSIKAMIVGECRKRGLRVITSGSAGGRRDGTQVRVVDLGMAGNDPLLFQVRRKLRRDYGWPVSTNGKPLQMDVPCVFSAEKVVYPQSDGSCSAKPEAGTEKGLRLDCSEGFGAATHVTGAFGFALAGEVMRRLAE
jgi:tRNA A37 threonylcarbamoyladenosine dehydratase